MIYHLLIHVLVKTCRAKAEGAALREVTCDHCKARFVYQLKVSAKASAGAFLHLNVAKAKETANRRARTKLATKLRTAFDCVPCPACGHLQWEMVRRRKSRRSRYLAAAAVVLGCGAAALYGSAAAAALPWDRPILQGATLVGALLLGIWLVSQFKNENRSAARRTRDVLGVRHRAMLREEFDELLGEDSPLANQRAGAERPDPF